MRIIDKIFGDKKGNTVIYIILAVGILMLVGSGGFVHTEQEQSSKTEFAGSLSLKTETERILSQIKGVGEADVMISFEESDRENQSALDINSASQEENSGIKSVLVVADGGQDAKVREKIVRAVKAALGVDAHKIEVFERKE